MRAALDACVLFPTVLREVLTGAAAAGLYQPVWSDRILEEWARATAKLGPAAEVIARGGSPPEPPVVRMRGARLRRCGWPFPAR